MRRIKLVLAVVAAMVATLTLAGPALASTYGSCIHMPLSPTSAVAMPTAFPALLLQLAAAVGIVLVVAAALVPVSIVRSASADTT